MLPIVHSAGTSTPTVLPQWCSATWKKPLQNATQKSHLSSKIRPAAPAVSLKEMDLPQAWQRSRLCRDHFIKRLVLPVPAKPLNHQSVPPGCFQGCLPVCAIQQRHIDLLSIGQLESPTLGAEDFRILATEVIVGYSSNTWLTV